MDNPYTLAAQAHSQACLLLLQLPLPPRPYSLPNTQPPASTSSLVQHDHKVSVVELLGSKAQGKSPGQVPHLHEGWQFCQALGSLLLHQFCVQLCPGDKARLEKETKEL